MTQYSEIRYKAKIRNDVLRSLYIHNLMWHRGIRLARKILSDRQMQIKRQRDYQLTLKYMSPRYR